MRIHSTHRSTVGRGKKNEADHVGILLAGAACHDPKAGPKLWDSWDEMMAKAKARSEGKRTRPLTAQEKEDEKRGGNLYEWLSTHPSNDHRTKNLAALVPAAEKMRSDACTAADLKFMEALRAERRQRRKKAGGAGKRRSWSWGSVWKPSFINGGEPFGSSASSSAVAAPGGGGGCSCGGGHGA